MFGILVMALLEGTVPKTANCVDSFKKIWKRSFILLVLKTDVKTPDFHADVSTKKLSQHLLTGLSSIKSSTCPESRKSRMWTSYKTTAKDGMSGGHPMSPYAYWGSKRNRENSPFFIVSRPSSSPASVTSVQTGPSQLVIRTRTQVNGPNRS